MKYKDIPVEDTALVGGYFEAPPSESRPDGEPQREKCRENKGKDEKERWKTK